MLTAPLDAVNDRHTKPARRTSDLRRRRRFPSSPALQLPVRLLDFQSLHGRHHIIPNSLACKSSVFLEYTAGSLTGVLLSSGIFSPLEERRMFESKGPHSACLASLAVGYELMLFNHSLLEIINRLVLCTIKQMPRRLLQVTASN